MGSYSFTVVIEPDGDQFHVYVPALPGCHSFGDNQDEALANIREAIELHVESMLEDGEEVPREPEPARVGRVTIPIHPAKTVPKATLRAILRDAGLSVDDLLQLL